MSGTQTLIDTIEITLRNTDTGHCLPIYIDVFDTSLSRRWLTALNGLLQGGYHLEKNYCFLGFAASARNGEYIIRSINQSIEAINRSDIGYRIDNVYTIDNSFNKDLTANQEQFNLLHRYFEDLQGVSGSISPYYTRADSETRWHIRQLNLLCHEFESWALSKKKQIELPQWQRPSQLMCWLNSPRFVLEEQDYESFGIESLNRPTGGVFVGVNKAVGKHHWEVFVDEARFDPDHRTDKLTTITLRGQTEAAGDFDIEWAQNPAGNPWQIKNLADFRTWLKANGFDPDDRRLTIGHPQVAQVDLKRSFGTDDYQDIWQQLDEHLDVYRIKTSTSSAEYKYTWSDSDYKEQQIQALKG